MLQMCMFQLNSPFFVVSPQFLQPHAPPHEGPHYQDLSDDPSDEELAADTRPTST